MMKNKKKYQDKTYTIVLTILRTLATSFLNLISAILLLLVFLTISNVANWGILLNSENLVTGIIQVLLNTYYIIKYELIIQLMFVIILIGTIYDTIKKRGKEIYILDFIQFLKKEKNE